MPRRVTRAPSWSVTDLLSAPKQLPARFAALCSVASLFDASVTVDGVSVVEGAVNGPTVVVLSDPSSRCPSLDPARRALVLRAPEQHVLCASYSDPLVASSRLGLPVGVLGSPAEMWLDQAGVVCPDPATCQALVSVHGKTLVCRHDEHVFAGSLRAFDDDMLGHAGNVALLVSSLTGSADRRGMALVSAWSSSVSAHAQPLVVDASKDAWEMPVPPAAELGSTDFMASVRRASRALPSQVHEALLAFADDGHRSGALLLRGLPVGVLPATPESPNAETEKDHATELLLLAVARVLGQPAGFRQENGGRVVQNLVPTRAGAYRQVSTSSAVTLAWHTETAFHPHRPRFLVLFCLRGDPSARTTLCSIREILPSLSLATRATLTQPLFRTAADESFGGSSSRHGALMPVLRGDSLAPQMVFDAELTIGTTPAAAAALTELIAAIEEHHTGVVLEPGDLLVIDNTVAVHGRSPFTPRFDGTDRWLQRTFVVADLAPSAAERSGRVIDTAFLS